MAIGCNNFRYVNPHKTKNYEMTTISPDLAMTRENNTEKAKYFIRFLSYSEPIKKPSKVV